MDTAEIMGQLPVAAIVIIGLILLLREVGTLLKDQMATKKNGKAPPKLCTEAEWRTMCDRVHDLWEWHNVKDDDGVYVWYIRKSLSEAIRSLADSATETARINAQMIDSLNQFQAQIGELGKVINKMNKEGK